MGSIPRCSTIPLRNQLAQTEVVDLGEADGVEYLHILAEDRFVEDRLLSASIACAGEESLKSQAFQNHFERDRGTE